MTKEEIESYLQKEKIMSMKELIQRKGHEGIIMGTEQVVRAIAIDELKKLPLHIDVLDKSEVGKIVVSFSPSTAQRQINELRAGKKVLGPIPTSLEPHSKAYYPIHEVAAVMYLQSHPVAMYGSPSLGKILQTRHD